MVKPDDKIYLPDDIELEHSDIEEDSLSFDEYPQSGHDYRPDTERNSRYGESSAGPVYSLNQQNRETAVAVHPSVYQPQSTTASLPAPEATSMWGDTVEMKPSEPMEGTPVQTPAWTPEYGYTGVLPPAQYPTDYGPTSKVNSSVSSLSATAPSGGTRSTTTVRCVRQTPRRQVGPRCIVFIVVVIICVIVIAATGGHFILLP